MAELVYAGNYYEFEEYCARNNLVGGVHYISDPLALYHVAPGTTIHPVGSYRRRADFGQVSEICLRRGLSFRV